MSLISLSAYMVQKYVPLAGNVEAKQSQQNRQPVELVFNNK